MDNRDDILQQKLIDLESGIPLEHILADIPTEEKELSKLIRLAADVRSMPHPRPRLAQKYTLKHTLTQRAVYPPGTNGNGHRSLQDQQSPLKPKKLPGNPRRFMPLQNTNLAAAAILVGVLFIVGFIGSVLMLGGIWLASAQGARAATIENVTGTVEMATSAAGVDWQPLLAGDEMRSGQRLRTGPNSSATLVFFDGSRARLDSQADITLNRVDGGLGKVLRVVMTQNAGKSSHQVVLFFPLNGTTWYLPPLERSACMARSLV